MELAMTVTPRGKVISKTVSDLRQAFSCRNTKGQYLLAQFSQWVNTSCTARVPYSRTWLWFRVDSNVGSWDAMVLSMRHEWPPAPLRDVRCHKGWAVGRRWTLGYNNETRTKIHLGKEIWEPCSCATLVSACSQGQLSGWFSEEKVWFSTLMERTGSLLRPTKRFPQNWVILFQRAVKEMITDHGRSHEHLKSSQKRDLEDVRLSVHSEAPSS